MTPQQTPPLYGETIVDQYDELRAAAAKASNGNLDSAESVTVDEIQCPFCGDGIVDRKMWTNIDNRAVGIEVFGLGEALTNYETFVRLANPETIKALLSERDSLLAALERFGEISGEGDEGFPDDTPVTVLFGRSTNYSLHLGDLRRAAALTTKEG